MIVLLWLILMGVVYAVPMMPLEEVTPGLPVHGLTVLKGDKLSSFEGEVIDVLPQAVGTMSLILVELKGAGLEKTGIISGMSGSPVYAGEKLLGAVAYGWSFSKKPIAGVTPAIEMADLLPRREGRALLEWALAPPYLDLFLAPSHLFPAALWQPLLTPLMVSGMSPHLLNPFLEDFLKHNFYPLAAPSSTALSEKPFPLKAGYPVGVPLMGGDIDFTAIGTITFCEQNFCVAFGHPFLELDHLALPATGAYIHTVIPRLESSFKLGSRGKVTGAMIRDRQQGILIEKGRTTQIIPAHFSIEGQEMDVKIAQVAPLFPILYKVALLSALEESLGRVADMTVKLTLTASTEEGTLKLKDSFYYPYPAMSLNVLTRLKKIIENPFGQTKLKALSTEVHVEAGRQTAELIQFSLPKKVFKRGEEVPLRVAFSVYPGKIKWQTFRFKLPRHLPKNQVEFVVLSGKRLKSRQKVPPSTFAQWNRYYSNWYQSNELVILLSTSGREIGLSGEPLSSLPETLLGIFSESDSLQGYVLKERQAFVFPTAYVLSGQLGGILTLEE